ncbi:MAG: SulP family sulfate permease [Paraglaciecola sp.]|jgi:SulP family sulfate permease
MNIKQYIPALDWLANYDKANLKGDLAAGLTVGVMLIPQGMAYAMIAGLPPIYGLYACTIPIILYALLGTSRQLAVGPVAMVSLLTASGIGAIAEGGTELYILLAITLALFVGVLQFLLGVFRLGFLVNFLSHPVISGFTSAAALIIGLSQLKHLLGVNIPRSHHITEIIGNAIGQFGAINWITFGIGIGGIILIKSINKFNKSIPSQLVAVIFGVLLVWGFGLTNEGVKIVGEVPDGLPSFMLPSFEYTHWEVLLPIAITIALVSFMESIAVAKSIQSKHRNYKIVPNQELIALGAANIGGAFFQSYPVTGGFSRTAVNDQAGAKTGLASIFSVILIVLTLLFFTPLFYYLPKAILASVIMVAVFGLIDYQEVIHLWKSNRRDFVMLMVTFVATLTLGIELGIGVGIILSLAVVLFQSTRPHVAILANVPKTDVYRNINRFNHLKEREDLTIIRFDNQLYFANVSYFKEVFEEELNRKTNTLKAIILSSDTIYDLDSSAVHALEEVLEDCKNRNVAVYFSGVRGPVRDAIKKGHLIEKIGANNFFLNVQGAVDCFDKKNTIKGTSNFHEYTSQVNV